MSSYSYVQYSDPHCIAKKYHLLKRPFLILFLAFGSFRRPCPLTWCPSPTTPSTSGAWSTTSSTTQSRSNLWESWDPSRTSGWKKTRSWAAPILICIRVRFQQKKISLRCLLLLPHSPPPPPSRENVGPRIKRGCFKHPPKIVHFQPIKRQPFKFNLAYISN